MAYAVTRAVIEPARCRGLALCVACAFMSVLSMACGDREPLARRNQAAEPGPGDSLAKLTRRMLEADEPVAAMHDYKCEIRRLAKLYGPAKAMDIQEIVEDTTYKPDDEPARRRVESALAHRIIRTECPASEPGPGDSLAKLTRRMLDADDPIAAAQDYMCEIDRLIEVYGPAKATDIQEIVEDTTYKPEDDSARRRVERALANRVFRANCPGE